MTGHPFRQLEYLTSPERRLDTTRIYREAYERAGIADRLLTPAQAQREADAEFIDEPADGGL